MNVGELKKMLEKYPDTMRVIHSRFSDYVVVEECDWSIVEGVDQGDWIMDAHSTMSAANKAKKESFLHLVGN